jgi:5-dehydro-2-deoxygluconokinase
MGLEAIVVGRVGADLYPNQVETPLSKVRTFTRFAGGFSANVATGLARLGVDTAIVSRVGNDGHGQFVREFLASEGIDVRWLETDPRYLTPLVFCEVWPPERFPLLFYREPTAPDWEITSSSLDLATIRTTPVLLSSGTCLARSPSRETTLELMESHDELTVFDLDWRPSLWREPQDYPELARRACALASIVIGNEDELRAATEQDDPEMGASDLLTAGPSAVIVKRGPRGVMGLTGTERVEVPGIDAPVVNGLGAGDAFAAALTAALLQRTAIGGALCEANAAGAYVAGQLACSEAMPTRPQLDEFLARSAVG